MTSNSNNVRVGTFEGVEATNSGSWAKDISSVNLDKGGQWGLLPMVGGIDSDQNVHEWMYNQPYVKRDVIPIVLETPRVFDLLPNSQMWHNSVKALFEVHAKTISGLNSSLNVETTERELGLSGATFEDIVNVVRESTKINITTDEKYGIPFEILLDTWIRYGIMDPDMKAPLVTTLPGAEDIGHYGPEWWTCTVLFVEPDVLLRSATHGWFVSNMFPHANPDILGRKDKNSSRETKDISLDMGGFAIPPTNKRVMELATSTLDNLKLYTRTPDDIILPATDVASYLKGKSPSGIYYEGNGASLYEGKEKSAYE